jgi:putative PIN family toxin of toxin-antitoxin system
MKPYQIVMDTNVLVAAARSRRGASYALLKTIRSGAWQMNLSTALMMEYEAQLKIEAMRQSRPTAVVDRFLDFLLSVSNQRQVYLLLRPFLRDQNDDFIIELAVASRSEYIVTWNIRDFAGAAEYAINVISPASFLALLKKMNAIQIELPDRVYARAKELAREKKMPLDRSLLSRLWKNFPPCFRRHRWRNEPCVRRWRALRNSWRASRMLSRKVMTAWMSRPSNKGAGNDPRSRGPSPTAMKPCGPFPFHHLTAANARRI